MKNNRVELNVINCNSRLQLVKIFKDNIGLGLKDAKDLSLSCIEKNGYTIIDLIEGEDIIEKFISELDNITDIKYDIIIGSRQFRREHILLQLGFSPNQDYIDFLIDLLDTNSNIRSKVLNNSLSKLSREDLIESFEFVSDLIK